MAWEDPIVAEVHRARKKLMEDCNYDIDAFFEGVRKRQAARGVELEPGMQQSQSTSAPHLGTAALGTVGALVRVTPWDELQYWASCEAEWVLINDRTPFVFRVEGWLEDGHISYGVHGPVVDGPARYRGLRCSIIVRVDGSDWRVESCSSAAFKVGPNIVVRSHQHDFRHPEGTTLEGYPRMSRFGEVQVVGQ